MSDYSLASLSEFRKERTSHECRLSEALKALRLSGLAESLAVRLQEAQANRLAHAEFLELVLADELAVRQERQIARRVKAAAFRETKTLEDFDWDFNRSIKRKPVFDLAAGHFVRRRQDVLLVGPPGVGKSHLAQAIGSGLRQGRLYGALPLDLRRGARPVARRSVRGARPGDGPLPAAGPADLGRHGHQAAAETVGRVPVRDHHATASDSRAR